MGLQSQLNDVSYDSIPLLLIALIANCVNNLRSFLFGFLHSLGLLRFGPDPVDDGVLASVGSGLAGLIVLADQLKLNRAFSYRYSDDRSCGGESGSDCVVCMSTLRTGDHVRRLSCRHVFHKDCFEGWLGHLNFNCPLCRSPLVSDERVNLTRRQVGADVLSWFSLR